MYTVKSANFQAHFGCHLSATFDILYHWLCYGVAQISASATTFNSLVHEPPPEAAVNRVISQ